MSSDVVHYVFTASMELIEEEIFLRVFMSQALEELPDVQLTLNDPVGWRKACVLKLPLILDEEEAKELKKTALLKGTLDKHTSVLMLDTSLLKIAGISPEEFSGTINEFLIQAVNHIVTIANQNETKIATQEALENNNEWDLL